MSARVANSWLHFAESDSAAAGPKRRHCILPLSITVSMRLYVCVRAAVTTVRDLFNHSQPDTV